MDEFEIYLPSNTINNNRINRPGDFEIELSKVINTENFDVGLKSITYPNTLTGLNHLEETDSLIILTNKAFNKTVKCFIPYGRFNKFEDLIDCINFAITNAYNVLSDQEYNFYNNVLNVDDLNGNDSEMIAEGIGSEINTYKQFLNEENKITFFSRFHIIKAIKKVKLHIFPFEEIEMSANLATILGYESEMNESRVTFKFKFFNDEGNDFYESKFSFDIFNQNDQTSSFLNNINPFSLYYNNTDISAVPYNNNTLEFLFYHSLDMNTNMYYKNVIQTVKEVYKKMRKLPLIPRNDNIEINENNNSITINGNKLKKTWTDYYKIINFKNNFNLDLHHNNIYIYCNIINYIHVGNTQAPLLKVIPIDNKRHYNIEIEYLNPSYRPIKFNEIKNIEISLKNDFGKEIMFQTGHVILLLSFKRKNNSVLLSINDAIQNIREKYLRAIHY